MTVSINIRPGIEDRLAVRARSSGQTLEGYIQSVLEREATLVEANFSSELTGKEKAFAYRKWAKSFPAISLEDISRESIYQRD